MPRKEKEEEAGLEGEGERGEGREVKWGGGGGKERVVLMTSWGQRENEG